MISNVNNVEVWNTNFVSLVLNTFAININAFWSQTFPKILDFNPIIFRKLTLDIFNILNSWAVSANKREI